MDDGEDVKEDDENANRSNSKSLTLHPDKSVLENEEVDPVKVKKDSESLKFFDELKARLKKLKQEEAEDVSNMNVTISLYYYTQCLVIKLVIYFSFFKNRVSLLLLYDNIILLFYMIIITIYNFVYSVFLSHHYLIRLFINDI